MKNGEIAKVFADIADLLELKGENVFKVRAYQKVARAIEQSSEELEQLVTEDRVREVPGVGEAIAKKITELVTTGRLEYYEKLKAEFPAGISTLVDIPGVGPKGADAIIKARRKGHLTELGHLRAIGIRAPQQAVPYILLDGHTPTHQLALGI